MKRDDIPLVKAVEEYIKKKYGVSGDCPFPDDFDDMAFRHLDNRKWFALLLLVRREKFFPEKPGELYLLNLKNDPRRLPLLFDERVHPAYHMNRKHWLSCLLDEGADLPLLKRLIDESYALTAPKKARSRKKSA